MSGHSIWNLWNEYFRYFAGFWRAKYRNYTTGFIWAAPSEFGTYRICEQRRFRRACASAQSRQNLRCSLIQVVSQEEPSDRKPDPWPLWMAGHAQLKFVMTECSKTQIRLTGLIYFFLLESGVGRSFCLWLFLDFPVYLFFILTDHKCKILFITWPFQQKHWK